MNTEKIDIKPLLITIDGPAGAGKTTVSKSLANRLGFLYVDTGALYRAVAFEVLLQKINPDNALDLGSFAAGLGLRFKNTRAGVRLISNQKDITDKIRTPEVTMLASAISARPDVRTALFDVQKQMGAKKSAVFEGRDMGTVVFPDADVKFFLTADLKTRAMRRFSEYAGVVSQSFEDVLEDMKKRDNNDSSRTVAPLKPAENALIIDSTDISPGSAVDSMVEHVVLKYKK